MCCDRAIGHGVLSLVTRYILGGGGGLFLFLWSTIAVLAANYGDIAAWWDSLEAFPPRGLVPKEGSRPTLKGKEADRVQHLGWAVETGQWHYRT